MRAAGLRYGGERALAVSPPTLRLSCRVLLADREIEFVPACRRLFSNGQGLGSLNRSYSIEDSVERVDVLLPAESVAEYSEGSAVDFRPFLNCGFWGLPSENRIFLPLPGAMSHRPRAILRSKNRFKILKPGESVKHVFVVASFFPVRGCDGVPCRLRGKSQQFVGRGRHRWRQPDDRDLHLYRGLADGGGHPDRHGRVPTDVAAGRQADG